MITQRLIFGVKIASGHLVVSTLICFSIAVLILGRWYPFPYNELSAGKQLFLLVVSVDLVCGPLLTLVLANPRKSHKELARDLILVGFVQLLALGYGIFTLSNARPLYMVFEVDRFKIISSPQVDPVALANLDNSLELGLFDKPKLIAVRRPVDEAERQRVMFEAANGGRDYAERPEFYIRFDQVPRSTLLSRAKPLQDFAAKQSGFKTEVERFVDKNGLRAANLKYLPVIAREDWIAVIDESGSIKGYIKGDGF